MEKQARKSVRPFRLIHARITSGGEAPGAVRSRMLGNDNEQVEKAKAAVDKVREKHSADRAKLQDLSQEERREKSRAINQVVSEETMKALEDVLKPEQIKRFKQIELQRRGGEAFTQLEV